MATLPWLYNGIVPIVGHLDNDFTAVERDGRELVESTTRSL